MELVSLLNIKIQESHIYYRRLYLADVVFEYNNSTDTKKVKFIIETTPLGDKHVTIDFIDTLNYPVLKLMISIKRLVIDMESKGQLS